LNSETNLNKIVKAVKLINNAIKSGNKVYVHCQCGVNRSPTIVGLYLTKYYKFKNFKKAILYIKKIRPQTKITNKLFKTALIVEKILNKEK
jgi:protein-tyrosine phosphatase